MKNMLFSIIIILIGFGYTFSNSNDFEDMISDKNFLISKSNEIDLSGFKQQLNKRSKNFSATPWKFNYFKRDLAG